MKINMNVLIVGLALSTSLAFAEKPGSVYFKNVSEGASILDGSTVKFGVDGMKVLPAGKLVKGTGHHHLIIDGSPVPAGEVIPADETRIHFGKGQKETQIHLSPGHHSLTLQFADGAHRSYGPEWSATVNVKVK